VAERFVIPDDVARAAAGEGRRDDAGTDFALKVGWPHPEAEREADGLRTWDGAGALRLCQVSELAEATMLLLERCRPGPQLRASPPEEHDLVIGGLLRRLRVKPLPAIASGFFRICATTRPTGARSGAHRAELP
jgi:hypothetical protein